MNNYDKFVYLTICEISLPMVKKTQYVSYSSYCRGMNLSLKDGDLSFREKGDINKIWVVLDKIYCMSREDTGKYISDYFANMVYLSCEISVKLTKEYFPNVFN
jgi:hypothetical protein